MGERAVVLLSGGLDSAANLALSQERFQDELVLALTACYGQRAEKNEVRASLDLSNYYQVRHETLSLPWLGALGGGALTDSKQEVPRMDPKFLDQASVTQETARQVWVPNRNGVLINVAAAYAERWGAEKIIVGFNSEEARTFPDNSLAYLDRITESLALSTRTRVKVVSYTAEWDKRRIVSELRKLLRSFPFDKIWSCYLGGKAPCRVCESCQRLARAVS